MTVQKSTPAEIHAAMFNIAMMRSGTAYHAAEVMRRDKGETAMATSPPNSEAYGKIRLLINTWDTIAVQVLANDALQVPFYMKNPVGHMWNALEPAIKIIQKGSGTGTGAVKGLKGGYAKDFKALNKKYVAWLKKQPAAYRTSALQDQRPFPDRAARRRSHTADDLFNAMIADTPAAPENFRDRLVAWLLRPYIDLGPLGDRTALRARDRGVLARLRRCADPPVRAAAHAAAGVPVAIDRRGRPTRVRRRRSAAIAHPAIGKQQSGRAEQTDAQGFAPGHRQAQTHAHQIFAAVGWRWNSGLAGTDLKDGWVVGVRAASTQHVDGEAVDGALAVAAGDLQLVRAGRDAARSRWWRDRHRELRVRPRCDLGETDAACAGQRDRAGRCRSTGL